MKSFVDDIIAYIADNFSNDGEISKKVSVGDAYDENAKLTPPYIFVQQIDDSDAQQYDTFDGEAISYVPIQISSFCQQMKIAGTTYTAKQASAIFADKIKDMFDIPKAIKWNNNIKLMRRVGGTPSMPTQKGTTTYFSPTRYDFYVNRNYKKINKGEE